VNDRIVLAQRTEIDQRWTNYQKALRAQIRLKHSIAADNEINRVLPKAWKEFEKQVQTGMLPAPLSLLGALDG
jgi:hypothetical protein